MKDHGKIIKAMDMDSYSVIIILCKKVTLKMVSYMDKVFVIFQRE